MLIETTHPALTGLIEQLEAEQRKVKRLRSALRDAMAWIPPDTARDYDSWKTLLDQTRDSIPAKKPDAICPQCGGDASNNWFDRTLCSEGDMHTRCTACGFALDGCGDESPVSESKCPECDRELHGYRGPLCRYCDPWAASE